MRAESWHFPAVDGKCKGMGLRMKPVAHWAFSFPFVTLVKVTFQGLLSLTFRHVPSTFLVHCLMGPLLILMASSSIM